MIGDNNIRTKTVFHMIDSLSHRGDDSWGSYEDNRVSLCHTRLAILGIAEGQQPVFNKDRTVVSITNGEIYNYRECADTLKKMGYSFSDSCDTNIIPCLYEAYGMDMFYKINGQFAIAIWDKKNDKLILARDRFGEKPLYYRKIGASIYFCSEIDPLLKINNKYELNAKCLKDICTAWVPIGEKTIYKDIFAINNGSYLTIENNIITVKNYYSLTFINNNYAYKSKVELISELDILLKKSVEKRINADVPISFYLSGGLDSGLIAAMASQYIDGRINTFSLSFSDNNLDEASYQHIVSKKLNSNHFQLKINSEMIVDCFSDVLAHIRTPILRLGVVPMYLLAKFVHDNGFKVALSGEGADELFGGYDLFKETKIRSFCERIPSSKRRAMLYKKTNSYINDFKNNSSAALATFFNQVKSTELFSSHAIRFGFGEYCFQFFSDDMKAELKNYSVKDSLAANISTDFDHYTDISKAQYIEIKTFMSRYLLSSQGDCVSMAHSVECRYPFLDNDVVEFALKLNDRYKIDVLKEKSILKELSAKYLPLEIINRPKFPYRAMINSDRLLSSEKINWAISEQEINKYNVFNSNAVDRLLSKVRAKNNTTEKELMLLVFIISTQMLLRN